MQILVEYMDGSVEVKSIKSWSITNGCLVTVELPDAIYVPLGAIRKFIPNYTGSQKTTKKKKTEIK